MGPKITIDSATLMNKGLEVIEAHWLFDLPYERIEVIVHPQSIVHGIVELIDASTLLQAAPTDMRVPIQAALLWPRRLPAVSHYLDFNSLGALEFQPVDHERFPLLHLAYQAGKKGRSYPAALNGANEVAVAAFLSEHIAFTDIPLVAERVLDAHEPVEVLELDAVLEVDSWARQESRRITYELASSGGRMTTAGNKLR